MNTTQRVHILPTITGTPFFIREYVPVYLRATGKHGTIKVANYGPPLRAHDKVEVAHDRCRVCQEVACIGLATRHAQWKQGRTLGDLLGPRPLLQANERDVFNGQ